MQDKKDKIYSSTLVFFWLTFAFVILTAAGIFSMNLIGQFIQFIIIPLVIILSILGIILIILASRVKLTKISKAFFILAGASTLGIIVSVVLHNLVFALLIKLFGESFLTNMGDEPVFFIMATIICPAALLVGVIGSIVLIAKKRIIN
ncbi:MAG: hypothetical protein ACYCXB_11140 [Candidatus Humimicrobiaceae bacterium]